MRYLCWACMFVFVVSTASNAAGHENTIAPDLGKINDAKIWKLINATAETALEDGQQVVRLKPMGVAKTSSDIGLALAGGLEFDHGVVEIDLKGNGKARASFLGIAFNVQDGARFEAIYFRPFNFQRDGKEFRSHSVQYVAWPENTWEKLRTRTPGKYESTVSPVPDPASWFHARIDITRTEVNVFVENAREPSLKMNRLAGGQNGKIGLWVDSQIGAFRNLKISPAR
jgi:hypothetical protein